MDQRLAIARTLLTTAASLFATLALQAQSTFVDAPSQIPSGFPFNAGSTENVDFADVDGDGDFDIAKADGGTAGNQQSRLWINRGFEAGGTIGYFADRTAAQFPAVTAASRDIEFADIDDDGDVDIQLSNTSDSANQASRWWINMGGIQGGTQGYFQDQTSTRWVGLGGPGSSIKPSVVLASGGFLDWCDDSDFGDLDSDGDLDLLHSSIGPWHAFVMNVPSRLFLNAGGYFTEFNPSGYQLTGVTIADGSPALWAMGTQLHNTTDVTGASSDVAVQAWDVEIGDIDGDLDADIWLHDLHARPRVFINRLVESGETLVPFLDKTAAVLAAALPTGTFHTAQEYGDIDGDDDLDLYCVNWIGLSDATAENDGTGTFVNMQTAPGSSPDDNEADFLDYDNDGDLDVYVAAYSASGGGDHLYRNDSAGAGVILTNVTAAELAAQGGATMDADAFDLDDDGDVDVVSAKEGSYAEHFLLNIRNDVDTFAPRLAHLEQAADRDASTKPTTIRVQQYDNQAYYGTWYNATVLHYRVVPGAFVSTAMRSSGGANLFRGEIPGTLLGTIEYYVEATDNHGNVGVSVTKSFVASCGNGVVGYCTAGTSTNGCVPVLTGAGTPSATAPSGFTVNLTGMEGQKAGLFFYGINGRKAVSWGPGSTSYACVFGSVQRTPTQNSGGTADACDGSFALDWNDYVFTHPTALGQPFAAGAIVNLQTWYRDPPSAQTTNLSAAIEFFVCD